MHTAGTDAAGQSLISPGSCMREFRTRPCIECNGLGRCNYFATAVSYWLSTIDDNKMFQRPEQQTLKSDQVSKVSRCAVCMRRRPAPPAGGFSTGGDVDSVPNAVVRRPRPVRPRYRSGPYRRGYRVVNGRQRRQ
uniref:Collagen IV NC1 domain-containing protein n=3 Tax=Pectinophora gossypiella TaxID=13191 RepID=A0A1E1WAL7_PECGO